MSKLSEIKEEYGKAYDDYKVFFDSLPETELWSAEQIEEAERRDAEIDGIQARLDAAISEQTLRDKQKERAHRFNRPTADPSLISITENEAADAYQELFFKKMLMRERVSDSDYNEYLASFSNQDMIKNMTQGSDPGGGYTVIPEKMINTILQNVDDAVYIRKLATTIKLSKAQSLGVLKLDGDVDDFEWTGEIKNVPEDDGLTFGKRQSVPHPIRKKIKVSKTLLRNSAIPMGSYLSNRMSIVLGKTMEKAYMTGDGQGKALGLFVESSDGISSSQDVVGTNTTTVMKPETLIDMQTALKPAYWPMAKFLFHPKVWGEIRKMKDGQGNWIWQPALSEDVPGRILGMPYIVSEFAPSSITASQYVAILGDFSNYWVVDALAIQMFIARELHADTNQDAYYMFYEGDGQPVLEEAFVRMQMAAAAA